MTRLRAFYSLQSQGWRFPHEKRVKAPSELEPVRQWLLNELLSSYGYPQSWLESGRIRFCDREVAGESALSISVTTENGAEFMRLIALPGDRSSENVEVPDDVYKTVACGQVLISDGTLDGTVCFRRRFDTGTADYIVDIDTYVSGPNAVARGDTSKSEGAASDKEIDVLQPLTPRMETILLEAHDALRDVDGLHADAALDEVCKVLLTKYYDEATNAGSVDFRFNRARSGCTEEYAASLRETYLAATEALRSESSSRHGSHSVFREPIRLSSPALSRIGATLQHYAFRESDADVTGRAFQQLIKPATRAGMGQYFTPDPVIRLAVDIVRPTSTDTVLDPFAGSGHFLAASHDRVREMCAAAGTDSTEFATRALFGIEKSERMVRVAATDMCMHGDGHSNIYCMDSLVEFSNFDEMGAEQFTIVMTNPPFGSVLGSDALAQLGNFDLSSGVKKVPLEVLGLERSVQFLRPGGKLAIVLPDGLLVNKSSKRIRSWIQRKLKVRVLIGLPTDTFAPFGANVRSSVMLARKWESGEATDGEYDVLTMSLNDVGYDASGRPTKTSEVPEALQAAQQFLNEEGW